MTTHPSHPHARLREILPRHICVWCVLHEMMLLFLHEASKPESRIVSAAMPDSYRVLDMHCGASRVTQTYTHTTPTPTPRNPNPHHPAPITPNATDPFRWRIDGSVHRFVRRASR